MKMVFVQSADIRKKIRENYKWSFNINYTLCQGHIKKVGQYLSIQKVIPVFYRSHLFLNLLIFMFVSIFIDKKIKITGSN